MFHSSASNRQTSSPSAVTTIIEERERPHSPLVTSTPRVNRRPMIVEELFIEYLFARIGRPAIQIVFWDGTQRGDPCSSKRKIIIRNPRGLRRILFDPIMGFCEGFMANDISVEGDLVEVLTEMNRGLSRNQPIHHRRCLLRWPHFRNSISSSKSRVNHHYDIGNEFYQLWLDPQYVYTCAYYYNSQTSLEQAQIAKLDHVCRKLRLKPGESVIEAGCGWGALALHMARKYGVTVRAFNLSHEQVSFARTRAAQEGLSDRVEFIEDDYRNIQGRFDAFVSVGMLEHVGAGNYRHLGQMIDRVLNRGGRGLIHSIGRNVARPLDRWTVKYIFPGAYAPSLREMMDLFEDQGFSVIDVENLRLHYVRTCVDWLARFDQASDQIQKMFDEQFVRMWRLYLAASSAAFQSGDLQLFQVLFARADNNDLAWTRADWYATEQ